jgi:hypothetical protein
VTTGDLATRVTLRFGTNPTDPLSKCDQDLQPAPQSHDLASGLAGWSAARYATIEAQMRHHHRGEGRGTDFTVGNYAPMVLRIPPARRRGER